MRQNAEFLRIVKQLNSGDTIDAESDSHSSLDNTTWSQHDEPFFPLVESEFDNYWNPFDPFEVATAADPEDHCRVTGTPPCRQAAVMRQLALLSPSPPPQQQQQPVYSSGTKRPRNNVTSPVLLECGGEEAEQSSVENVCRTSSFDVECQRTTRGVTDEDSAVRRPSRHSLSDAVDAANVAMSSASSIDIPVGLLSSLPPNCNVYITHRPASTRSQKSPPPVTQIIINHTRPSSMLPPLSIVHHRPPCCMPSLLPLPTVPLSPQVPPPSTTVNQFHPLVDVRREPAPNVSVCRNRAPLTTVVRPPKSLSTYAAEFRHHRAGVSDVSAWKYETARRASDSATEAATISLFADGHVHPDIDNRHRHCSSTVLPTSKITTSSLMPTSVAWSSANNFQHPTSLALSLPTALPSVLRQRRREPLYWTATAGSQSLPNSWQRGSVECVVQSQRTPTTSICVSPQTPGDETDGSLIGLVSSSCLEDSTADSSSSSDKGSDGATCSLSNALHYFCASYSSSPSSLVQDADNHGELPSPVLTNGTAISAVASAKPHQRTIDALSKKIQRNQTQKTEKPTTVVSKKTLDSSFTRPDSFCSSPPSSRQLASTLFSLPASLSSSDTSEISAVSGYRKSCEHKDLLKNEYADVSNNNNKGQQLSVTNDNRSVKDPVLPSRRKRIGRRKSQSSRQLAEVEKVGNAPNRSRQSISIAIAVCHCASAEGCEVWEGYAPPQRGSRGIVP